MLDVKQAVKKASEYFSEFYPEIEQKQLEEIEKSEDGKYWLITLSYPLSEYYKPSVVELMTLNGKKQQYKSFKVDASTGEVISMKIRSV
ncbi:MAG: hypothetical protein JST20_14740 [Bacteroidetes bacterium]|nr:hypothetical protein [Bacteroidota bacterium]